jgi:hypothetical protein
MTVLTAHRTEARVAGLAEVRRLLRWLITPVLLLELSCTAGGGYLASRYNATLHPVSATVVSQIALDTSVPAAAVHWTGAAMSGEATVPVPANYGSGTKFRLWLTPENRPAVPEDVSRDAIAAGFLALMVVLAGFGLGYSCWWPHHQDRLAARFAARDEARWQEIVTELVATGVGR